MNPGISRNDTITLVARIWEQTNVNSALAWAGNLPDSYAERVLWMRSAMFGSIRTRWPHPRVSRNFHPAPREIISSQHRIRVGRPRSLAAIHWVNSLPDGRDKDEALAGIAESWANQVRGRQALSR